MKRYDKVAIVLDDIPWTRSLSVPPFDKKEKKKETRKREKRLGTRASGTDSNLWCVYEERKRKVVEPNRIELRFARKSVTRLHFLAPSSSNGTLSCVSIIERDISKCHSFG